METDEQPLVTPNFNNQKISLKWLMPVLIIVAVVGVGFGIAGVVIGMQKSNMVKDLEGHLAKKTEKLAEAENASLKQENCLPSTNDSVEEGETPNTEVQDNTAITPTVNAESAHNYIYVSEWGKKVNLPDGMTVPSYKYVASSDSLCVNAAQVREGMHYAPRFAVVDSDINCLAMIAREFDDNHQYKFVHYGPQAVISDADDKYEQEWEAASVNMLAKMTVEDF